jgi:hypothetical protein
MEGRALRILKRHRVAHLACALACLLLFAWEVRTVGDFRVDDAYITFAYSKTLAHGHGPVLNHGRTEGYSNFLWMALIALPLAVAPGLDPYIVARVLTLPFLLLLGWAVYSIARRRARAPWAWLAVGLLAMDSDLAVSALSGLETVAYAALVSTTAALYLATLDGDARAARWVSPVGGLVALTRIDGFLVLGGVLLVEAVRTLWRKAPVRRYAIWAAPGLVLFIGWFTWRWAYYRLPLPSTYYAKQLIPQILPHRGWEYVSQFWQAHGLVFTVPFVAIAVAQKPRHKSLLLLAGGLLYAAYVARVGGDWMPFGRFLVPILPLVAVLFAWGIAFAIEATHEVPQVRWGAIAAAVLCLIFVVRRVDAHFEDTPEVQQKRAYQASETQHVARLVQAARLLQHVVAPGDKLVTDYAGSFGYYTEAEIIDMWGLCTPLIAREGTTDNINPIYGKTCPRCYAALQPDFFHVLVPLLRPPNAFSSHQGVVASVWQSGQIGRYVDLDHLFVTGRVTSSALGLSLFFIERKRPQAHYLPRSPAPGILIDYPFVAASRRDAPTASFGG